jgi:hypothetical protein
MGRARDGQSTLRACSSCGREFRLKRPWQKQPTPPIQTLPARWGLTHRFPDGHRYGAMRPYNISAGLLSLRRVLLLCYFCATRTNALK